MYYHKGAATVKGGLKKVKLWLKFYWLVSQFNMIKDLDIGIYAL